MNRLGKKCLIASLATHGLLALILIVGPAFFAPHDQLSDMPLLDVIPAKLIDAMASGGGNPKAQPPPPPARPPEQPTKPAEPVRPPVAEPVKEPKPVKAERQQVDKATPTKRVVEISTQLVKRKTTTTSKNSDTEPTQDDARAARAERKALNNVLNSLKDGLSSSTRVEMPPGPGGEAYANYAQAVKSIYEHDWTVPDEAVENDGTTRASVTILRDGTVASAHVIRSSGNPTVDRSVERTLERVKFIAPFPEGATERERTFTISFNLKAKRLSG